MSIRSWNVGCWALRINGFSVNRMQAKAPQRPEIDTGIGTCRSLAFSSFFREHGGEWAGGLIAGH